MLLKRYRIVYVEVPSGHPGVDILVAPDFFTYENKEDELNHIEKEAIRLNDKRIAVLHILEGK